MGVWIPFLPIHWQSGNAVRTEFVWDPTEPIATRPLAMRAKNWGLNLFYTHDGNKNVSEVFYHALQNGQGRLRLAMKTEGELKVTRIAPP